MIVDANLLLYAEDESSPFHPRARSWLEEVLNGATRVGLPWPSLFAFARIRTHPGIYRSPLTRAEAWSRVHDWLAAPAAWVPYPGERHAEIVGELIDHTTSRETPCGCAPRCSGDRARCRGLLR